MKNPAGFFYQRSHRRLTRSQTDPLDYMSLNESSRRPISLFTATPPRAPPDRRVLSPLPTCQCDTTSTNEARPSPTSDHDDPAQLSALDSADHELSTEPGTSEAKHFAPIAGETLANQTRFVAAVLDRANDDAQESPRDEARKPTQDVNRGKSTLEPTSQTQRLRRFEQEASQEAEEKRRILAAEQTHRFVTDYISKISVSAHKGDTLSALELDAINDFLAGFENSLSEIAPMTTVAVTKGLHQMLGELTKQSRNSRSYAERATEDNKNLEKMAEQLATQAEHAAQNRMMLEQARAGLQQKITEERAKNARASLMLGQNQLIPPASCSRENREQIWRSSDQENYGTDDESGADSSSWYDDYPAINGFNFEGGSLTTDERRTTRAQPCPQLQSPSLLSLRPPSHSPTEPCKSEAEDAGSLEEPAGLCSAGNDDDEEFRDIERVLGALVAVNASTSCLNCERPGHMHLQCDAPRSLSGDIKIWKFLNKFKDLKNHKRGGALHCRQERGRRIRGSR